TSPSPSPSPSSSPSPSPSASTASPTPSRSPEPTTSTTTPTPSAPAFAPEEDGEDDGGGGTLQRGDRGSEVTELQQRLAQLYLYMGEINGTYNPQVEDAVSTYQWARGIRTDDLGVYGEATRQMLESETHTP
ncbi:peptidoglycan-binding domain-containing protein, partial [Streptomyces sp. SID5910]|uniref:peptidoglycan-binding domain-containing protein n=1 Tax=Streptomyces sp. SID5910 TaxID=2690312 RepID=UPI00136FD46D